MPVTSTLLGQAHNTIDRKLFAMKGFHHPGGSQVAFLTGLAHLYHLVPYQRRALHGGQCGVEMEGGRLPTPDWMLNLQILTSGDISVMLKRLPTKSDGMCAELFHCHSNVILTSLRGQTKDYADEICRVC